MTEYADRRNKELASAFITSTCQLIPKPSLAYADHMHNLLASKLPVPTSYTIICGSLAEFYIRPLITCIDDEDFLVAKAGELVFSGEFPVLPRDFSGLVEKIEGYKIESYEVVQNGCHVVCVKHHSCRNDKYQWRFSLLFIDDVARIVGLCVLQKRITENNLYFIDIILFMDLRLSPEMFAHYLFGLSAERLSKQSDFYHDLPDSLYPMDVNLKGLTKPKRIASIKLRSCYSAARQVEHSMPNSLIETEALNVNHTIVKQRVLDALMGCALENMTSFYNAIRKDFGFSCNTADCYRALYLYKCRQYDKALHLCEQILKDSNLQNDLKTRFAAFM